MGGWRRSAQMHKKTDTNPRRKGIAASTANIKFDNGPASETSISADRDLWFNTYGLTGTGFAHPNPANSSSNEPIGSRCEMGFRVKRPLMRGVSSPNIVAVHAWANSCTVKAITSVSALDIKVVISRFSISCVPEW